MVELLNVKETSICFATSRRCRTIYIDLNILLSSYFLNFVSNDQLGDTAQAIEWFMQLIGIVPTDAAILQRLGEMYDAEGDKSQAFQYHYDVSFVFVL